MPKNPSSQTGTASWQAQYIDTHAAERSQYLATVAASDFLRQVAERTHTLLDLRPGQRVVEVGCGGGVFLPGLAQRVAPGGSVVGVDHSVAFVAEARAKAALATHGDLIEVQQGDAYKLPFPDATFDAAHCERVLMHLEDPTAAIREMARVVRPGGVVAAAEPDWAGIRFYHPDREAFELVYSRALGYAQPDVGITLLARFGAAGLVDRKFFPVTTASNDFAVARMYGLKLEPAVELLVAEGAMPADRLRAVVPVLEAASDHGDYYCVATMHVVAAVVARVDAQPGRREA